MALIFRAEGFPSVDLTRTVITQDQPSESSI